MTFLKSSLRGYCHHSLKGTAKDRPVVNASAFTCRQAGAQTRLFCNYLAKKGNETCLEDSVSSRIPFPFTPPVQHITKALAEHKAFLEPFKELHITMAAFLDGYPRGRWQRGSEALRSHNERLFCAGRTWRAWNSWSGHWGV